MCKVIILSLSTLLQSLPVVTVEVQPDIAYSSILVSLLPHADRSALLLVENHCGRIAVKFMQR